MDTSVLLNNAPKAHKDFDNEAQILHSQIQQEGVNNIAVVAPYGAGKSSAIKTYLKNYRSNKNRFKPKYVQISLADFNDEESYDENAIERSILQQLLYSQKKDKLPNSSIARTNKSSILRALFLTFTTLVFLLSTSGFVFELCNNSIFGSIAGYNSLIGKILFFIVSSISLGIILFYVIYGRKLRKVKYKNIEAEFKDEKDQRDNQSLINKFIDEVLYFFECINLDLVIFEDLDRFKNLKVFIKLRELNTIINNSPKRAKKVTFLYAVKDDMFKDETERAKFFEFILPIIPIVNPITTKDNITEINNGLKQKEPKLGLSEQFIKDISFFVSDMRILKNTFNDYLIAADKLILSGDNRLSLKNENLFALSLYKNLFPYDYSRLQNKEGLISLLVNKERLIANERKIIEKEISELEKERSELLNSFNELKYLFIGQNLQNFLTYQYSLSNTVDFERMSTFKDLLGKNVLVSFKRNTHYLTVQEQHLRCATGSTYYEREQVIKAKQDKSLQEIDSEIQTLKKDLNSLEQRDFNSLVTEIGLEEYFSDKNIAKVKTDYKEQFTNQYFSDDNKESYKKSDDEQVINSQIDFIRLLINRGYIDENYIEYTSNYRSSIISLNDRDFIRSVAKGEIKTYNPKLDNIREVIRTLSEDDFGRPAILVNSILKC